LPTLLGFEGIHTIILSIRPHCIRHI